MVTFNNRPGYLNGKTVNVCHISDLRIIRKKDRKAKFSWTDLGNALVSRPNEIEEMKGCNHFLGSYVGANKYAVNAIRDTSPWGISAISDYEMVSILGKMPPSDQDMKSSPESDLKYQYHRPGKAISRNWRNIWTLRTGKKLLVIFMMWKMESWKGGSRYGMIFHFIFFSWPGRLPEKFWDVLRHGLRQKEEDYRWQISRRFSRDGQGNGAFQEENAQRGGGTRDTLYYQPGNEL